MSIVKGFVICMGHLRSIHSQLLFEYVSLRGNQARFWKPRLALRCLRVSLTDSCLIKDKDFPEKMSAGSVGRMADLMAGWGT